MIDTPYIINQYKKAIDNIEEICNKMQRSPLQQELGKELDNLYATLKFETPDGTPNKTIKHYKAKALEEIEYTADFTVVATNIDDALSFASDIYDDIDYNYQFIEKKINIKKCEIKVEEIENE